MTLPDRIAQAKAAELLEKMLGGKPVEAEEIRSVIGLIVDELSDENDRLRAEIDRLQPYIQHRPECRIGIKAVADGSTIEWDEASCSCGLSSLRDGQPVPGQG